MVYVHIGCTSLVFIVYIISMKTLLLIILLALFSTNIVAQTNTVVDADGDGLIDINDLETLNAIRFQLDGTSYRATAGATGSAEGCPDSRCIGYELMRDLDFNDDDSYSSTANKITWTTGAGWQPIGDSFFNAFTGQFEGNGFTISNLMINRSGTSGVGLFGSTGSRAEIANVGLLSVDIIGDDDTGALVGENSSGIITNSYATGSVSGDNRVGGLVGWNISTVTNSYATGSVSGSGSIGGLVGRNDGGSTITNSYATGSVSGSGDSVGGLVGWNISTVTNSYATGSVSGSGSIGGLVGWNRSTITNSYATGSVSGSGDSVGGLVGWNRSTITNSYATGSVSGDFNVGGLVGSNNFFFGTIFGSITNSYATGSVSGSGDSVGGLVGWNRGITTNSYWDVNTSGIETSAGGRGETTQQLQAATDTGSTSGEIYYNWSTDDWDFGTSIQYPVLKYTDNPNTASSECRSVSDTTTDLPVCGSLLSPALRYGLSELQLVEGDLSPDFDVVVPSYRGTVVSSASTIQFRPITVNPDAKVYIMANEDTRGIAIGSGNESGMISLNTDGTTTITIEVENGGETTQTVRYTLYLNYYEFNGDVDRDDDGLIEIDDLEGLNAMRYQLDGTGYRESETAPMIVVGCPNSGCIGYELTRDLDFNDADSYSSVANRVIWTTGEGWQPVGDSPFNAFTGEFEGNDFTISNLRIGRSGTDRIGLFGFTSRGAEITNVDLLDVNIIGSLDVGSLVGRNSGTIMNSYATGSVSGRFNAGGLVGLNRGIITNSYATGSVSGDNNWVGGLVGRNRGTITNSYATGSVSGDNNWVGGLVGENDGGTIVNSYATGSVSGDNNWVGGLVGRNSGTIVNSYATGSVLGSDGVGGLVGENDGGTIVNSYATSSVSGSSGSVGGLVGFNSGTITNSYWDITTSGVATSAGGRGSTTQQLQAATDTGSTPGEIYYNWSTDDWDFGTSIQYPVLKYTDNPNTDSSECRSMGDTTTDLPVCGSLLSPTLRYGLSELQLVEGDLSPDFDVVVPSYRGTVVSSASLVQFRPITVNSDAKVYITTNEETRGIAIDSGGESSMISLNPDKITTITIKVENGGETTQTVIYTFSLNYYEFIGDVDRDDDGLIEIDNLEGLNAMRYQPDGTGYRESETALKVAVGCPNDGCRGYELTRDLDFNDDESYSSTANRITWTTGAGWQPIGDSPFNAFTGEFEGNGFTISNLRIGRSGTDRIGLFGFTSRGAEITNVDLLDVNIIGSLDVGSLVGRNSGTIMNSYATGSVSGRFNAGGLVGLNRGTIMNSYATGSVSGDDRVGGLVGFNFYRATITNSYATGSVSGDSNFVGGLVGDNNGIITNSYATGSVSGSIGSSSVGGLVGANGAGTITNSYATGPVSGGSGNVGGLVGQNNGTITNSYATGSVSGDNDFVGGLGGLVGLNRGTITNSYATGSVSGDSDFVGGLVGLNRGTITNSYATGSVSGDDRVGGLVGANEGTITNSYATGSVLGDDGVGGLVGANGDGFSSFSFGVRITTSYATGSVSGSSSVGGLVGVNFRGATITDSYWDIDTSGVAASAGGTDKTTMELQSPTRATGIYRRWSNKVWDFGTNSQYPILKYTDNPNTASSECRSVSDTTTDLPVCGSLLSPILRYGLSELQLVGGDLSPDFDVVVPSYRGTAISSASIVRFRPTTLNPNAKVYITANEERGMAVDSGDESGMISLNTGGVTTITIDVENGGETTQTARYTLFLDYYEFNGDVDRDDDGLIEIDNLEALNAMRYQPDGTGYRESETALKVAVGCPNDGCRGYELTKDLDFNDADSYSSTTNRIIWTTEEGWQPIGDSSNAFTGKFEGNGFTISNLTIDRSGTSRVGLFGYTRSSAEIANVGLLSVDITGNSNVGGLVGWNDGGTITNSYATSSVLEGDDDVGGLVGENGGTITNSYATGSVSGDDSDVGGLVGWNRPGATITNSYATGSVEGDDRVGGLVGQNERGRITNSYATGSVSGSSSVGGLVGSRNFGTITSSYWDINSSGVETSAGGRGETTQQLQAATDTGSTSDEIYYNWSTDDWDFGTSIQYPALKYTDNPNTASSECRSVSDTTADLPVCGSLLSPILRYGLSELQLVEGDLSPDFDVVMPSYRGTAISSASTIQFRPITLNPDAMVYIMANEEARGMAIDSGGESGMISLDTDGTTTIIIEVENGGETTQTVRYTLYLNYYEFIGDVDRDDDGLIEIDNLEGLNAMRYQPDGTGYRESETALKVAVGCPNDGCRGYELTKDLDFNDANSYSSVANRVIWITGEGWQPIGNSSNAFIGRFEGNDFTISNLTIARGGTGQIGLFGRTDSGAEIANLGLLNVNIIGGFSDSVGGLVGRNDGGTITNSYATGSVSGDFGVGGLVGRNDGGTITNSYATGSVSGGGSDVGGLVGFNNDGTIMNSYATSSVSGSGDLRGFFDLLNFGGLVGSNGGTIVNSYATGSVLGSVDLRGFFGFGRLAGFGGLVGWNRFGATITNSYATGSVSGGGDLRGFFDIFGFGGLVGENGGTIVNSYATSSVSGSGRVGGLVGDNSAGNITNSYAAGSVSGISSVGGLVGGNRGGTITNSYAMGSVSGNNNVGGLVGDHSGTIANSYATGSVLGSGGVGGLVGQNYFSGAIANSYATGSVEGSSGVGGLLGRNDDGTITSSYWDINTSGIQISDGGTSKTTVELKTESAQGTDPGKPYYEWSNTNWDFGTDSQYPVLKYTDNPNTDISECRSVGDTTTDLPVCGSLLSPALRYGLGELQLVEGDLSPDFDVILPSYRGTVVHSTSTIRFRPITVNPDAKVYIRADEEARGIAIDSGDESSMISLNTDGITAITIEVENGGETTQIVIYTLYLNYYEFNGDVDRDDDGLIEIDDLEGLNAIRYQPDGTGYRESEAAPKVVIGCPNDGCRGYELTRDLDFNDAGSYGSIANRITWTTGAGWQPIGDSSNALSGQFEGNGFTISNIRIDRSDTSEIGLFGHTGSSAEIANLGLLNVNIIGGFSDRVGGLVGQNNGTITNSYATGSVSGNDYIGGLVGANQGTITNSYATGSVLGDDGVGGLVGANGDDFSSFSFGVRITTSYATGSVSGNNSVGGLVGENRGTITNSYATGSVSGDFGVGGLVGENGGIITNSYATGSVSGSGDNLGGLVGRNFGTTTNSYWDINSSGIETSAGGTSQTTVELQAATGPGSTSAEIYYNWSTDDWDFGTSVQYPVLKYTDNPNTDISECRRVGDTTTDLPVCGSLLSPALRYGLSELQLVGGNLSPDFDVIVPSYRGTVVSSASTIQFRPITLNPGAKVYITADEETRSPAIASGDESGMISLNTDGITTITIEVENGGETTQTITYTLYLNYYEFNGDVDRDDDGLIEIDNLEGLNAMRYQLDGTGYRESETAPKIVIGCPNNQCRGYELTRDLDFNDADSYSSIANRITWTTGAGWQPIGNSLSNAFSGQFEGNGFTISNLRIDRSGTSNIGLFGSTGVGAEIANVGLLNVDIMGASNVGGLVGWNDGIITNSYATGSVSGTRTAGGLVGRNSGGTITNSYATGFVLESDSASAGGLVGWNDGTITNSYATGSVSGDGNAGGLVGYNLNGTIMNSYATGSVPGDGNAGGLVGWNDGIITNSYATGSVPGDFIVGGLVGRNQGIITNSYATGSVSASSNFSVGGLVGYNGGTIMNSYATSSVSGGGRVGGLVGDNDGTITNSYWDINTSGIQTSSGGRGATTQQLQVATDTGSASSEIYYNWSTDDWDFGTSIQYPILKFADSDILLSGQGVGLRDLEVLTSGARLSPIFGATTTHYVISFLAPRTSDISLRLKAYNAGAVIKVVRQGEDTDYFENKGSDGRSEPIPIDADTTLVITVTEVDAGATIYMLSPTSIVDQTNTVVDADGNGLIDINDLETLNAIRYQPDGTSYKAAAGATGITEGCPNGMCRGYELTRDLDFNDNDSYSLTANRIMWTMGAGWQPIGDSSDAFSGKFEGNGFTISNLTINSSDTRYIGLFGYTRSRSEIANLGLLNIDITASSSYVGGLVGWNESTMTNTYATGSIIGTASRVGGLVGRNSGIVMSSYAMVSVSGTSRAGGLVGRNYGIIVNSYASGSVMGSERVGGLVGRNTNVITSSYATGSIEGTSQIGGLVGRHDIGTIANSYAIGVIIGDSNIGSLVGRSDTGTTTDSYWDINTSGIQISAGGTSKTTVELQSPTTATDIYIDWSTTNWDFGTSIQYPILKFADSDILLSGQGVGLRDLEVLTSGARLSPIFGATTTHYVISFLAPGTSDISLRLKAYNADAVIKVVRQGEDTDYFENKGNDGRSEPIPIDVDTTLVITVTEADAGTTIYMISIRMVSPQVGANIAPTIMITPSSAQTLPINSTAHIVVSVADDNFNRYDVVTLEAMSSGRTIVLVTPLQVTGITTDTITTFMLSAEQGGEATITFTATDSGGLSDSVEIPVRVNTAPTLSGIPEQPIRLLEGLSTEFDVAINDADADDSLNIRIDSSNSMIAIATVIATDDATRTLEIVGVGVGNTTITVTVNDGRGVANSEVSEQFTVQVQGTIAPILEIVATPEQPIQLGSTAHLVISVLDGNFGFGDRITLTAASSSRTIVSVMPQRIDDIGSQTRETLTLRANKAGVAEIKVIATDRADLSSSRTLEVVVNTPPTGSARVPTRAIIATVGEPFERDISDFFSDADGDTLTYGIAMEPMSGLIDNFSTMTGVWTFMATNADASQNTAGSMVTVSANDGRGGRVQASFTLLIDAPLTGTLHIEPDSDDRWQLITTSTLADVNGITTTSYRWFINNTLIDGATENEYRIPDDRPSRTAGTRYRLEATVVDNIGQLVTTQSDVYTVPNIAPMITLVNVAPASASEGGTVRMTAEASDENFDSLSYRWRVSSINADEADVSGETAPLTIRDYFVTDATADTATAIFVVVVGDGMTETTGIFSVVVNKEDNGVVSVDDLTRSPTTETRLIFTGIDETGETDGGVRDAATYHWQQCLGSLGNDCSIDVGAGSGWRDIVGQTGTLGSNDIFYEVPSTLSAPPNHRVRPGDRFRVKIAYTDLQAYTKSVYSSNLGARLGQNTTPTIRVDDSQATDITLLEGERVMVPVSVDDRDGSTLNVEVVSGNDAIASATISEDGTTRTLTISGERAGETMITATVDDGTGEVNATASLVFDVTVAKNTVPTLLLAPSSAVTLPINSTTDTIVSVSDDNFNLDDVVTLTAVSSTPSVVSVMPERIDDIRSDTSRTFMISAEQGGVSTITFTATDSGGLSDSVELSVRVNTAPTLSGIPEQPIRLLEGLSTELSVAVNDADANDSLNVRIDTGDSMIASATIIATNDATRTLEVSGIGAGRAVITVTVNDDRGVANSEVSAQFEVRVEANTTPTIMITPSSGQTLPISNTTDTIVSVSDDNFNLDDIVTLEAMSSSRTIVSVTPVQVANITTDTSRTFRISAEQGGEATITFTATDIGGLSDSVELAVRVNTAPTLSGIPEQPIRLLEGLSTELSVAVNDADADDSPSIRIDTGDSMIASATIIATNDATRTLEVSGVGAGHAVITVTVNDDRGVANSEVSAQFEVRVEANTTPTIMITPSSAQTLPVNSTTDTIVSVTDSNFDLNDIVTLAAMSSSRTIVSVTPVQVANITTDTSRTFRISAEQGGEATITFTATDIGGLSDSIELAVRVNTAPTLSGIPEQPIRLLEGLSTELSVAVNDADADDSLNVRIDTSDSMIATATIIATDDATRTLEVSGVGEGEATITVTVNDGRSVANSEVSAEFEVQVEANTTPTIMITPSSAQTLPVNTTTDTIVSVTDSNFDLNDIVALAAMSSSQTIISVTPAQVTDITTDTITTFRISAEQGGEATITFTATDRGGLSDSVELVVRVNTAPTLSGIPEQPIRLLEGLSTEFDVAINDADADDSLSVRINTGDSMIATATIIATDDATRTLEVSGVGAGRAVITVTVNDDRGVANSEVSAQFEVRVEANTTPTIMIIPSSAQTLPVNSAAQIAVLVADDNFNLDDIVTLEAMSSSRTIVSVTPVQAADITTDTITTFVISAEQEGEATITFTATDSGGLSDSETVSVDVTAAAIRIRAKVFLEGPLQ